MGVVRERKVVCENTKSVPSNPESAAQSGYTTQESEDEGQAASPRRRPVRQRLIADGSLNLAFNRLITCHTGQRKVRRILNTHFLETLNEDSNEFELDVNSKSKFQILMEETEDALGLLEAYEREQEENARNGNVYFIDDLNDNLDPYLCIPRKIRAAINSRKNFQYELLKSIEIEITSQLNNVNGDVEYVHTPETCYERLLVHAVAKYNGFHSETVSEGIKKMVKVFSSSEKFNDAPNKEMMLCDYIVYLRAEE